MAVADDPYSGPAAIPSLFTGVIGSALLSPLVLLFQRFTGVHARCRYNVKSVGNADGKRGSAGAKLGSIHHGVSGSTLGWCCGVFATYYYTAALVRVQKKLKHYTTLKRSDFSYLL